MARYSATFIVVGAISKKRELTSAKNAAWRGYVASAATLGQTFELSFGSEAAGKVIWDDLQVGEDYYLTGVFELRSNIPNFICTAAKLLHVHLAETIQDKPAAKAADVNGKAPVGQGAPARALS